MMAPKMAPTPALTTSVAHKEQEDGLSPLLREIIEKATPQRYDAGRFAPKNADDLWALAEDWYYSGLLPEAYYPRDARRGDKTAAQYGIRRAVIVMRYGASLGVLPEQAIRQIYIVEGQPSPSAALMLSLALASGELKREDWRIVEATPTKCRIELFAKSRGKAEVVESTVEEYRHLANRTNWKAYPADMLVARATARAMRRYFPDMLAGVYAAEERVDMRQERAAGRAEDPVERILAAVEPTEEGTSAPDRTVEREEHPDAAAAEHTMRAEALRQRIEALVPGALDEAEAIRAELREMTPSPEKVALVRAHKAAMAVVTSVAQQQNGEEGGT
jgi:hypothetical protein